MNKEIILVDKEKNQAKSLAVTEIFSSIQGEGVYIGMPVTFIRLQGCHIRCPFCDSKATWDIVEANMSTAEIIAKCDQDIIVITGGEPCLQNLDELIELLHANDKFICMETSGDLPIPDGIDWVTCSPKEAVNYHIEESNFSKIGELKFVVTPNFDYETVIVPVTDKISALHGNQRVPGGCIWLQPESSDMQNMWKKAYDTAMQYPCRVGVQLHVLMEVR